MNIVAIIPARGGSKGLKRKNVLPLNGKPLIAYSIEAALKMDDIDRVIVSTDCEEIAEFAKEYGAEVPFIRPESLASDTATTIDVLKHTIDFLKQEEGYETDHILLLQPTSPLRSEKHVKEALNLYLENRCPVVSVCLADSHPYLMRVKHGEYLVPFVDQPDKKATRRQDLPEVYELNGAIYLTDYHHLMNVSAIYKDKVIPYVMDKRSSVDIDDEIDFKLAEVLLKDGAV
jgi:CMP-N,N'-diacetyllegionaminic acid synthase